MTEKVFGSGSYEEALGIIGEYVNITSVNEPGEDIDLKLEEKSKTSLKKLKGKEN